MINEYTNTQVVSLLGTTAATMLNWKNDGKINCRKEGRNCFFTMDDIIQFLAKPENKRYLDKAMNNINLLKPDDASRLRRLASMPTTNTKNMANRISVVKVLTDEVSRLNDEESRIDTTIKSLHKLKSSYVEEKTTFGIGEIDENRLSAAARSIDNSINLLLSNRRIIVSTRDILEEELSIAKTIFGDKTI